MRVGLAGEHFGEAVDPAGGDAVGGAGVQHFRRGVAEGGGHGGGFAGGVVGQAKDDQVDLGHDVAPGGGIAASVGRQAFQRDLGQRAQTLADAQAGGAGLAVDPWKTFGGKTVGMRRNLLSRVEGRGAAGEKQGGTTPG